MYTYAFCIQCMQSTVNGAAKCYIHNTLVENMLQLCSSHCVCHITVVPSTVIVQYICTLHVAVVTCTEYTIVVLCCRGSSRAAELLAKAAVINTSFFLLP